MVPVISAVSLRSFRKRGLSLCSHTSVYPPYAAAVSLKPTNIQLPFQGNLLTVLCNTGTYLFPVMGLLIIIVCVLGKPFKSSFSISLPRPNPFLSCIIFWLLVFELTTVISALLSLSVLGFMLSRDCATYSHRSRLMSLFTTMLLLRETDIVCKRLLI